MNTESTATLSSDGAGPADARLPLVQIAAELEQLERELLALQAEMSRAIEAVPDTHRESAKNLVHYVALRQRDLHRQLPGHESQRQDHSHDDEE